MKSNNSVGDIDTLLLHSELKVSVMSYWPFGPNFSSLKFHIHLFRGLFSALGLVIPFIIFNHLSTLPFFVIYVSIRCLFLAVIFSFISLTYENYKKTEIRSLLYYLVMLIVLGLNYYLETISFFLLNSSYTALGLSLFQFSVFCLILSPLPLIFFTSTYTTNKVNYVHGLPVYLALGMLLQAISTGDMGGIHEEAIQQSTFLNFVLRRSLWFSGWFLSLVLSAFVLIYRLVTLSNRDINVSVRRYQMTFLSGIVMIFLLSPLLFLINPFIAYPSLSFIWANVIVNGVLASGLSFLSIPYLTKKGLNFLEPQPIQKLMVVNSIGSLLYVYDFKTMVFGGKDTNDFLFSNAFVAITALMKEVSEENASIESIQFNNQLVYTYNYNEITYILFSRYETVLTNQRFEIFIDQMKENDQIIRSSISKDHLKSRNKLIEETILTSFGFQ